MKVSRRKVFSGGGGFLPSLGNHSLRTVPERLDMEKDGFRVFDFGGTRLFCLLRLAVGTWHYFISITQTFEVLQKDSGFLISIFTFFLSRVLMV